MRSWGVFAIYYFVKKGGKKKKENYVFYVVAYKYPKNLTSLPNSQRGSPEKII
jgi:hypothetical protein